MRQTPEHHNTKSSLFYSMPYHSLLFKRQVKLTEDSWAESRLRTDIETKKDIALLLFCFTMKLDYENDRPI